MKHTAKMVHQLIKPLDDKLKEMLNKIHKEQYLHIGTYGFMYKGSYYCFGTDPESTKILAKDLHSTMDTYLSLRDKFTQYQYTLYNYIIRNKGQVKNNYLLIPVTYRHLLGVTNDRTHIKFEGFETFHQTLKYIQIEASLL